MATNIASVKGLTLDIIPSELIKKELFAVVEKRLNSNSYKLSIEQGSRKGDNLMGEIFRILCEDKNNAENRTSLILKIAPRGLMRREKFKLRNLFRREIIMYEEVLSYFNDFQLSKGIIPNENGFNEFPLCYFNISENLSESLFLEDLKLSHFETMQNRQEPLTFEHISLMMKALGKFHAISFALKDQQPAKFKQLKSLLYEHYWTRSRFESFEKTYETCFNRMLISLEEENRLDLLEKLKKAATNDYIGRACSLVSTESAEPYAVICHGDLTSFNSMFRKNVQGTPIEIRFFDWQFSRCASPVTDLVIYLLCSSTKNLRDKHYEDFLKIYHGSLSDSLTRLGSNPQKLFPYEALLDQFRKFALYAAFVAALLLPMFFVDVDSLPDFCELAEKPNSDETQNEYVFRIPDELAQIYNKQVTEMFDDMDRFGYI